MESTHQHQIVQGGVSTVLPFLDMVRIAPARWTSAAGERAATVAGGQRAAEVGWHDPAGPADVHRLPRPVEHHRQDVGVAGNPAQLRGGQWVAVVEHPPPGPGLEVGQRDGHHQLGATQPLLAQYLVIGATFSLVEFCVMTGYAALASRVLGMLRTQRQMRATNRVFGGLFVAAGALLATFKRAA